VYGEVVSPSNGEIASVAQLPAPGQQIPLETGRVKSSIPRGGGERVSESGERERERETERDTWRYPSPQQFYRALLRKQNGEGVRETDVPTIVAIHNDMNEHTWREVERWEKGLHPTCDDVALLKFRGRPGEWSWLSSYRSLPRPLYSALPPSLSASLSLSPSLPTPFDRHDWIIQRCGVPVRYIIDYYHSAAVAATVRERERERERERVGGGGGGEREREREGSAIVVEVRPALDSIGALVDRTRAAVRRGVGERGARIGGLSTPANPVSPLSPSLSPSPPPSPSLSLSLSLSIAAAKSA
jgi:cytochrome c heme-lyase